MSSSDWLKRWNQVRARAGPTVWLLTVALGIGLVAYTDWRIADDISVGYLYLFPLVLAGIAIRHWGVLLSLVVTAALLREWFGPFDHSGWPLVVRNVFFVVTNSLVVFYVARVQARQRQLAETVTQQRDQLTRDLEEAAALQRLLIPSRVPDLRGWDLAARLYPARIVAGDLFDVLWDERSEDVAVFVADVAGKGAAAAMLMPVVQATVRRLRLEGASLDHLGASLNEMVAGLSESPRFVSLVYLELHGQTGDVEYINMGHPPPVLVTGGSESTCRWLHVGGPVTGAIAGARYEIGREHLDAGDTLLLYTDGASEAVDNQGEPFSEGRLAAVVSDHRGQPPDRIMDAVYNAVEAFRADPSNRDDVTLLVIRRRQSE